MHGAMIREELGTCRLSSCRNLLAATWFDAPEEAQMRAFRRISSEMQREHPAGTAMVNLVVDGTPRFHGGVREEAARLMKEKFHRWGAAHVVLVEGLRGVATRAFLTTAILVGRPKAPAKVFADLDSAAFTLNEWLARSPVRWTPGELRSYFEWAVRRDEGADSQSRAAAAR